MRFIVDARLPASLAEWLATKGHDAAHVASAASLQASDHAIWDLALDQDRIIVAKDRDFAIRASERRSGPQVVWLRLGNATRAALLFWREPRWLQIETRLAEGVHLIEVRP